MKTAIENIQPYLSLLSQEQFERLEDAILQGCKSVEFSLKELRDLEILLQEKLAKERGD